jgi:hypothetical protein
MPSIPGAPTGVSGIAGNGNARVSFKQPINNGGLTIISYTVKVYDANGVFLNKTQTGTTSPIVVSGLNNQVKYKFSVYATNSIGDSAESILSSAITASTGKSISLSSNGSVIAVGQINDSNGIIDSGSVRIYEYNNLTSTWVKKGQDIYGEAAYDNSGWSVSLNSDGSIIAIGAYYNDGINGIDSGHVRVYQYNNTTSTWVKMGQDIDGSATGDNSGQSVSLSSDGSVIAIGALNNDGDNGLLQNRGEVKIYIWNSLTSTWIQKGMTLYGESAYDNSGVSISLSSDGNTVAIGADYNDGNGENSGHVRIYTWNNSNWEQKGQDINGESIGDLSGQSISLSSNGNIVAIGAYFNDSSSGVSTDNRGSARVFKWNGTTWVQDGPDIDGSSPNDWAGYTVSLSSENSTLAVGAFSTTEYNENVGHLRVYQFFSIPDAPTSVFSTAGNEQISVSFTPPVNNGNATIISYTVKVYDSNDIFLNKTVTDTASPILITGLTNGTQYKFTVYATNSVGNSVESEFSSIAIPFTVPDAPIMGSPEKGDSKVTLNFTPPINNGSSAITSYTVKVYSNNNVFLNKTQTGNNSPIEITGLTNGTQYRFTVYATNSAGNSIESAFASAITPGIPDAPTFVSGNIGDGQITINFTPPVNNGGLAISSYTVNVYQNNGVEILKTQTGNSNPVIVTGLTNGTQYRFTIFAINSAGNSVESELTSGFTPIGNPNAPIFVSATANNNQVTVNFLPPINNGGSVITEYNVKVYDNSGIYVKSVSSSSSPIVVSGLNNDIPYKFSIYATNSAGNSINSDEFVRIPNSGFGINTLLNKIRQLKLNSNLNTVFSNIPIQQEFVKKELVSHNNEIIPTGSNLYSTYYLNAIVTETTDLPTIFKVPVYSSSIKNYNISGGGTINITVFGSIIFTQSDVNNNGYFFMIPNGGELNITNNTNTLTFAKYNNKVYQIQNNIATEITGNNAEIFILGSIIFNLKGIGSLLTEVSLLNNPICYIGESKVLVQDKETCAISEVCVKDISPQKYLVFSTTQQKFVPIKINCISGETNKFILIKKNLLGENKPSEDFYITPTHPILLKNMELEAKKIEGGIKVDLKKQLVYTLVTDNREALAINNLDIISWEYNNFMKKYKKKNFVWMEKTNENMIIIKKYPPM